MRLVAALVTSFYLMATHFVLAADAITVGPAETCRPAQPAELQNLSPEWGAFAEATDMCSVENPGGRAVIRFFTVSASRFYASKSDGTETVEFPKPILFDTKNNIVGRLPYSFPDDPPFALKLAFGDWNDGWPRRIELYLEDPTVTGSQPLPSMIWVPASRNFVAQDSK